MLVNQQKNKKNEQTAFSKLINLTLEDLNDKILSGSFILQPKIVSKKLLKKFTIEPEIREFTKIPKVNKLDWVHSDRSNK